MQFTPRLGWHPSFGICFCAYLLLLHKFSSQGFGFGLRILCRLAQVRKDLWRCENNARRPPCSSMVHHRVIYIQHTCRIPTMPVCTQLRDWIWDAERGFCLVKTGLQLQAGTGLFRSSPFHSTKKYSHLTYFSVWGHGKQAWITSLHCTCRAVCASSWSGKSASGGGQPCQSALYGGGRASGERSQYWEYVEIHWILGGQIVTRVRHRLPWCWHGWALYIGCDPPRGVGCQEGHNLQVHSLDTRTKNRHAAWDDVGRYTLGNLQVMQLKPVWNAWSCHLHREHFNTRSRRWDFVWRGGARVPAAVPAGVRRWASPGSFAAVHPSVSEEYCGSWLESAGERPLRCCASRASGGSSKIDCQLSYIQATISCRKQNLGDVFSQTWRSRGPVYPWLWVLT